MYECIHPRISGFKNPRNNSGQVAEGAHHVGAGEALLVADGGAQGVHRYLGLQGPAPHLHSATATGPRL